MALQPLGRSFTFHPTYLRVRKWVGVQTSPHALKIKVLEMNASQVYYPLPPHSPALESFSLPRSLNDTGSGTSPTIILGASSTCMDDLFKTLTSQILRSSPPRNFSSYPQLPVSKAILDFVTTYSCFTSSTYAEDLLLVNDNLTFFQLTYVSTLLLSIPLLFLPSINPLLQFSHFCSLFFILHIVKFTLFGVQSGVR